MTTEIHGSTLSYRGRRTTGEQRPSLRCRIHNAAENIQELAAKVCVVVAIILFVLFIVFVLGELIITNIIYAFSALSFDEARLLSFKAFGYAFGVSLAVGAAALSVFGISWGVAHLSRDTSNNNPERLDRAGYASSDDELG